MQGSFRWMLPLAATLLVVCEVIASPDKTIFEAPVAYPAATQSQKNNLPGSLTGINNFSKPFNEYTWSAAHNAYLDDMKALLDRGVRGFLLDIRPASKPYPGQTNNAYLCHTNGDTCDKAAEGGDDQLLSDALNQTFIPFLRDNPNEIVTILLESYVEKSQLEAAFQASPGIERYAFLMPTTATENWPRLSEMIGSDQRLVIITDRLFLDGTYTVNNKQFSVLYGPDVSYENTYDLGANALDHNWECKSRWDTVPLDTVTPIAAQPKWPRLFVMNQVHSVVKSEADAGNIDNNQTYLDRRVERYCREGAKRRLVPNYVVLDYTDVGDGLPYSQALTNGAFYFYEGPDADPDRDIVCVLPVGVDYEEKLASRGCENDEIQSMALRGIPKGARLTLYDDPDGNRQDDYSVINVKRDIGMNEKVVIGGFEETTDANADYSIYHLHNNGLNGKISRIKIEQAPSDFSDAAITFHEGFDASQNIVCTVNTATPKAFDFREGPDGDDCDNDEAKSATIVSARKGTVITVFGNKDTQCDQGCQRIEVKRNITWPRVIKNFDESWDNEDLKITHTPHSTGGDDLSGKVSSLRVELLPDTVPPGKPGAPIVGRTTSESATVTWVSAVDDIAVVSYRVSLNDGQPVSVAGNHHSFSGLSAGRRYTASVYAVDAAGNTSAPSISTLTPSDSTPPTRPGDAVATDAENLLSLNWAASTDNVGVTSYAVSLNGVQLVPVQANSAVVSDLATGDYDVEIRAIDAAGNVSVPSKITIRKSIENQPPTTPGKAIVQENISNTSAVLAWEESTDNTGVTGYNVQIDSRSILTTAANNITVADISTGKTYTAKVTALDNAGNVSEPSQSVFDIGPDLTPPTPPVLADLQLGLGGNASMRWTPSTDANGIRWYSIWTNGRYTFSVLPSLVPIFGYVALDRTKSNAFIIRAVDLAGNKTDSITHTIPPRKVVAPTGLNVIALAPNAVDVGWDKSAEGIYRLQLNEGPVVDLTADVTHHVFTGLKPNTQYKVSLWSYFGDELLSEASTVLVTTGDDVRFPINLRWNETTSAMMLSWLYPHDKTGVTSLHIESLPSGKVIDMQCASNLCPLAWLFNEKPETVKMWATFSDGSVTDKEKAVLAIP